MWGGKTGFSGWLVWGLHESNDNEVYEPMSQINLGSVFRKEALNV